MPTMDDKVVKLSHLEKHAEYYKGYLDANVPKLNVTEVDGVVTVHFYYKNVEQTFRILNETDMAEAVSIIQELTAGSVTAQELINSLVAETQELRSTTTEIRGLIGPATETKNAIANSVTEGQRNLAEFQTTIAQARALDTTLDTKATTISAYIDEATGLTTVLGDKNTTARANITALTEKNTAAVSAANRLDGLLEPAREIEQSLGVAYTDAAANTALLDSRNARAEANITALGTKNDETIENLRQWVLLNEETETITANAVAAKTALDTSISSSETAKGALNASISNGNTLSASLTTAIANGTTLKGELDDSITEAGTKKTALDGSIDTGTTLKGDLDTSIADAATAQEQANTAMTNANTVKSELNTVISDASTAKTNLETSIDVADGAKTHLESATGNARTVKGELDTAISNANTAKGQLESTISDAGTVTDELSTVITNAQTAKSNLDASVETANSAYQSLSNENAFAISNLAELQAETFDAKEILQGVTYLKAFLGLLPDNVLGLEVDFENKTFTRLCGAVGKSKGADFDSFNMFGGRKRCNLTDDGVVTAYYGDEAYTETGYLTQAVTVNDVEYPVGTPVQVMVEQPKFYYFTCPLVLDSQEGDEGGIGYHMRKVAYYICDEQVIGFNLHPAFHDDDGNEVDKIYFGAYEGCIWDADKSADPDTGSLLGDYLLQDEQVMSVLTDKFSSIAGAKPASGLTQQLTRPNLETICKNRGDGWHSLDVRITSMEQLLMIIEFGTLNTQTGAGSNGVVSITDNSAYNCSSITGSTASLGNASGQASGTYSDINGVRTLETANGKTSYSYRGNENPWGNIWKLVYGVNIWGDGTMHGGVPYICTDYNFAESKRTGNYESAGFSVPNVSGYINALGYSKNFDWLMMPSEIGGNSSLPVGDYNYVTANLNGYRIARLGGSWAYGLHAGGFYWFLGSGVGGRGRDFGGRLVYVPQRLSA